jgi:outer membrane protein TolC
MRWVLIALLTMQPFAALAKDNGKHVGSLSLAEYLTQVKTQNHEARATIQGIQAAELRLKEAEGPYSAELYAQYNIFDQRQEPLSLFNATQTQGRSWKAGVRDQNSYGTKTNVFVTSQRTNLLGLGPQAADFMRYLDSEQSAIGIELSQSLWRNAFGAASRSELEANKAASRTELLGRKLALKNILLNAENTYWSIVSYNQIIRLQEENVERAKRLFDLQKRKVAQRLSDDVEALQAQAAHEQGELELQTFVDEKADLVRNFNVLRGMSGETIENLSELPTGELLMKTVKDPAKKMSREDFQQVYESGVVQEGRAQSAKNNIAPQLDLVGSIASNGLENTTSRALSEAGRGTNANWAVGVVFSIPLDYRLIGDLKRGYEAQYRSAQDVKQQARIAEERTWEDLIRRNVEAQGRFEKAINLEKTNTELVRRERQRLNDGRTTTFQAIQLEQQLAGAQINRVRSQLVLLQIHNVMRQFEERP